MLRSVTVDIMSLSTFRLVLLPEQPGENILPSRCVLALKHSSTGEVKAKARFVIGGHRDQTNHRIVPIASTLSHISMRLVLALSSIFGFDVWSEDVRQAYRQSASNLRRKILLKPNELELGHGEFLQLVLPLYGLRESSDSSDRTLTDDCLRSASLTQSPGDLYLFFKI